MSTTESSTATKTLGIVIPTYNMADSMAKLMASIEVSGVIHLVKEVVIVDDASTDITVAAFSELREKSPHKDKWTILTLNENSGRFSARYRGAEILKTDLVFFLDARISLHLDFSAQLSEALKTHECLSAVAYIDESQSIYDLYWKRTHDWAFKKYYQDLAQGGLWLRPDNYDQYTKGTGAFVCPREIFLETCAPYLNQALKSDDTLLLKDISAVTPIHIPTYLQVYWHPRRDLGGFLYRLFERGPGFVEYHVFERQGLYFAIYIFGMALFALNTFLLLTQPLLGAGLLLTLSFILASSTLLFSKSIFEALKLAPLHYLSIVSYFFGSLWGFFVVLAIKLKPSPAVKISS